MERVSVNGVELEVDCAGSGEVVVFIHGAGVADSYLPLAVEPALRDRYRVIRYRRRGYAGSTSIDGPFSVAEHARDCQALLGALDVAQAHVVGHSYGAYVALQLAVDAPDVVSSLALFEPPLFAMMSGQPRQQIAEEAAPIMEKYMAGDRLGAVDDFLSLAFGRNWRTEMSRTVPGGPEQAENNAATLFECDLPSMAEWDFGTEETANIKQPVLFLSGAENAPQFTEFSDLIHSWLPPRTEYDVMPGANHLLHIRHPADAAARLVDFLQRNAVGA